MACYEELVVAKTKTAQQQPRDFCVTVFACIISSVSVFVDRTSVDQHLHHIDVSFFARRFEKEDIERVIISARIIFEHVVHVLSVVFRQQIGPAVFY
jgi:hypothetical protein